MRSYVKIIRFDGNDDYEFWSGFSLSKEDQEKINKILSKYETDGCSVSGTKQDIVDEVNYVLDHSQTKTENIYISRSRLEELATCFKDGLLCDDKESAMEYFKNFCDMNENEMLFFGIQEREDESNG